MMEKALDRQVLPSSISQGATVLLLTTGEHTYVISNEGSLSTSSLSCARTIGDRPQGQKVRRRSGGVGALQLLSPVPSADLVGALTLDHDLPADMDGCLKDEFQTKFRRSYITHVDYMHHVSASDVCNQPSWALLLCKKMLNI